MDMYFMAIILPEELNKRVLEYKHYMLNQYNCKVGLKSPAHITMIPPYWMDRDQEKQLLSQLDAACSRISPFPVQTMNFSAFKPRTIFIDVDIDERLNASKKIIDQFFLDNKAYGAKIDTRPFHPHITIATRDLYKKAFTEAWLYFESKEFNTSFLVSGLAILRHNKVKWEIIHTASFTAFET